MDRPPWQAWLTEDLYRELFRGGQADLDAFYDQVEDEERRYGIRAKCRDAEVYAVVARSRRATPMILCPLASKIP